MPLAVPVGLRGRRCLGRLGGVRRLLAVEDAEQPAQVAAQLPAGALEQLGRDSPFAAARITRDVACMVASTDQPAVRQLAIVASRTRPGTARSALPLSAGSAKDQEV